MNIVRIEGAFSLQLSFDLIKYLLMFQSVGFVDFCEHD